MNSDYISVDEYNAVCAERDELQAEVSRLTAHAPDDAAVREIRCRKCPVHSGLYDEALYCPFPGCNERTEAWIAIPVTVFDANLAALDAARARCAELEREYPGPMTHDLWRDAFTTQRKQWKHAGQTIRRLRRRWRWERRRANNGAWSEDVMEHVATGLGTSWGDAQRERDEAMNRIGKMEPALAAAIQERDTAAARAWHECCDAVDAYISTHPLCCDSGDACAIRSNVVELRSRYPDPREEAKP